MFNPIPKQHYSLKLTREFNTLLPDFAKVMFITWVRVTEVFAVFSCAIIYIIKKILEVSAKHLHNEMYSCKFLKSISSWLTISNLSPICSRLSFCAAPPSMILVTYMLLSPGMCWFPTPPAILKPSPACVCENRRLVSRLWVYDRFMQGNWQ